MLSLFKQTKPQKATPAFSTFLGFVIQQSPSLKELLHSIDKETIRSEHPPHPLLKELTHHEARIVLLTQALKRAPDTGFSNRVELLKETAFHGLVFHEYPFEQISLNDYKELIEYECKNPRIGKEGPSDFPFSFQSYILYILALPATSRRMVSFPNEADNIRHTILHKGHKYPHDFGFNALNEQLDLNAWDALHTPPNSGFDSAAEVLKQYQLNTPWFKKQAYWKDGLTGEERQSKHLLQYLEDNVPAFNTQVHVNRPTELPR